MGGLNIQRWVGGGVTNSASFSRAVVSKRIDAGKSVTMESALEAQGSGDLAYLLAMVREGKFQTGEALEHAGRTIEALARQAKLFDESDRVTVALEEALSRQDKNNPFYSAELGMCIDPATVSHDLPMTLQAMSSPQRGSRGRGPRPESDTFAGGAGDLIREVEPWEKSDLPRAIRLYERAIRVFRSKQQPIEEVRVIAKLVSLLDLTGGDAGKFFELHERMITLFLEERTEQSLRVLATVYTSVGEAHTQLGHYDEAATAYEKAIIIYKGFGEAAKEAIILYKQSIAFLKAKKIKEASKAFARSVQLLGGHMPQSLFQSFMMETLSFLETVPPEMEEVTAVEVGQVLAEANPRMIGFLEWHARTSMDSDDPLSALITFKILLSVYEKKKDRQAFERVKGEITKIEKGLGRNPS